MDSVPIVEVKIGDNSSPKKLEKKENTVTSDNNEEEVKESLSLTETEIRTKKVIKIQEENINGNYGKIYIQESTSKRDAEKYNSNSDKEKDKPIKEKEKKVIVISNATTNKNDNNKRKRVISVDNKYVRKNDEGKNMEKKYNLRKKSIGRGGDYKNILVTHIIYSTRDLNFHIIDPLMSYTEEMRKKHMNKIDNKNRNGRNGRVKVTYNSSCDNIRIRPKDKENLKGKTSVVSHRPNSKKVKIEKTIIENKRVIKENKEKKEGKEGKDSTIKISKRSTNTGNKGNSGVGNASYKKRNEKSNNSININIKKI